MAITLNGTNNQILGVPGQVLQVLQSTLGQATIQTSSTSFQSTGLFVTITPTSSTSKVLIMLNGGGAYMGTSGQTTMRVTVYRGSTDLSTIGISGNGLSRHSTPGGNWVLAPHSLSFLDSPATTSPTTYTVYFRNSDTNASVQFQSDDRGIPALTLMEISA